MKIDKKVDLFKQDILVMANRVKNNFEEVMEALKNDDKERALRVVELDEYINIDENNINEAAVELLSLMAPVARDLRLIIGGIKITNDLERIGDYAKNLGRFVIKNRATSPKIVTKILKLGAEFLTLFNEVVLTLEDFDVKRAYAVAEKDEELDYSYNLIVNKEMKQEAIYTFYEVNVLKNIERAGDHAKNICEQIIYIVKGKHIDFY